MAKKKAKKKQKSKPVKKKLSKRPKPSDAEMLKVINNTLRGAIICTGYLDSNTVVGQVKEIQFNGDDFGIIMSSTKLVDEKDPNQPDMFESEDSDEFDDGDDPAKCDEPFDDDEVQG